MPPDYSDDEALARALQEEYEKEYRRRSMQQHLRQSQERHESISRKASPRAPSRTSDTRKSQSNLPEQPKRSQQTPRSTDQEWTDEAWGFSRQNPRPSAPVASESAWGFEAQQNPFGNERNSNIRRNESPPQEVEVALDSTYEHRKKPKNSSKLNQSQSTNRKANQTGFNENSEQMHRGNSKSSNPTPPTFVEVSRRDGAVENSFVSDEEFARALDRELRVQEELEARRGNGVQQSALTSSIPTRPTISRSNSRMNNSGHGPTLTLPTRPTMSRSNSRINDNSTIPNTPTPRSYGQTNSRSSNATETERVVIVSGRMLTDEELARRIAQEEQDASLARTISATEQARAATNPSKSKFSLCFRSVGRLVSCLVTLSMLAIAIGLLVWYFGGADNLPGFIPTPEMFKTEDPFYQNPDSSNKWRNEGKGLDMTLINALDTTWNDYFYKAVDDWDAGNPDALTLQTQMGTPESACTAENGYIKVCNGDYGATNWRGINKVLLENGYIYASAARMNEYYFQGDDVFQRQYTMCHEMGHGFGLAHTDENFYNKDLGNCMDYTNNPENNMFPSEMNFKTLADLYGSVDGTYTPSTGDATEASASVPQDNGSGENQNGPQNPGPGENPNGPQNRGPGENPNGNRKLTRKSLRKGIPVQSIIILSEKMDAMIDSGEYRSFPKGWRKLRSTSNMEHIVVDLGNGYSIQYHLLLA